MADKTKRGEKIAARVLKISKFQNFGLDLAMKTQRNSLPLNLGGDFFRGVSIMVVFGGIVAAKVKLKHFGFLEMP